MYMHYIMDMNYPYTLDKNPGLIFNYLSEESINEILEARPKYYCLNDVVESQGDGNLFLLLEQYYPNKSSFEN